MINIVNINIVNGNLQQSATPWSARLKNFLIFHYLRYLSESDMMIHTNGASLEIRSIISNPSFGIPLQNDHRTYRVFPCDSPFEVFPCDSPFRVFPYDSPSGVFPCDSPFGVFPCDSPFGVFPCDSLLVVFLCYDSPFECFLVIFRSSFFSLTISHGFCRLCENSCCVMQFPHHSHFKVNQTKMLLYIMNAHLTLNTYTITKLLLCQNVSQHQVTPCSTLSVI